MKKVALLAAVAAAMLTACATSQPSPVAAERASDGATPIVIGESRIIQSAALGEARIYNVWLPPSYEAGDKRYPVLYLIDGGLAQDFEHIAGLAQLAALSGMFEEMIVVGVETKDRQAELAFRSSDPRDNEDFPTNGNSAAFRAFLTDELKPAIEARYRASGVDGLIGESLAGFFIVDTFLKTPDAVDAYIAISPSMWWSQMSLGKESAELLKAHPAAEKKLYLALASEGGEMRDGLMMLIDALKKQKAPGLAWTFSDRPDLEHSTIFHREALEALIWAFPNAAEAEE